jgi:GT2 family glycosyltransferase
MSEVDGHVSVAPWLSVIVRCYNDAGVIDEQLDALSRQVTDHNWEVVAVDNGSSDGSLDIIGRYADRLPALRVVQVPFPHRESVAGNAGVNAAGGLNVAFADADDIVAADWVQHIGSALMTAPVVASSHDYEQLNASRTEFRDTQRTSLQRAWYPPYYQHAGACGLGLRKDLFEQVGGFDPELPAASDTDLCFKLQRIGQELAFEPHAVVHVRMKKTPRGAFRQARRWAVVNSLMYRRYKLPGQGLVQPWRAYARQCRRVVRSAMRDLLAGRRLQALWQLGWYGGLLEGSLRFRQPPLASRRKAPREGLPSPAAGATRSSGSDAA